MRKKQTDKTKSGKVVSFPGSHRPTPPPAKGKKHDFKHILMAQAMDDMMPFEEFEEDGIPLFHKVLFNDATEFLLNLNVSLKTCLYLDSEAIPSTRMARTASCTIMRWRAFFGSFCPSSSWISTIALKNTRRAMPTNWRKTATFASPWPSSVQLGRTCSNIPRRLPLTLNFDRAGVFSLRRCRAGAETEKRSCCVFGGRDSFFRLGR